MKEPKDYLELAEQYDRAAEAGEPRLRFLRQSLAESYRLLAKSTAILARSGHVYDRVTQRFTDRDRDHVELEMETNIKRKLPSRGKDDASRRERE